MSLFGSAANLARVGSLSAFALGAVVGLALGFLLGFVVGAAVEMNNRRSVGSRGAEKAETDGG